MEISTKVGPTETKKKDIINLSDYKFCACIFFLMGRASAVNQLCHVERRNRKLGDSKFRVHMW